MKALLRILPVLSVVTLCLPLRANDKQPTPPPQKAAALKTVPENIEDLKAIQQRVKQVVTKVMPATVGVVIGFSAGSGVIIDKEGHVLTAAHVSGRPNQDAILILPDGRRIKAKTLGGNRGIDSGLMKITEKVDFPYVDMGKSDAVQKGQWVVAIGHPGGYMRGRTPPVRLGRVLEANDNVVVTDCSLVGGDSGGPLFDLDGKVIGIHSRIGRRITENIHVPVDTYQHTWERLVAGNTWLGGPRDSAYLGVELDSDADGCKVVKVKDKSAADKAGIKADDVLIQIDGKALDGQNALRALLSNKKVGDTITLTVQREKEKIELKVTLGRREE